MRYFLDRDYAYVNWEDSNLRSWLNDEFNEGRKSELLSKPGDIGWWWLRSPGVLGHAASVFSDSSVGASGSRVDRATSTGGVRPALWLEI